jgi:hypothetical protein
VYAELLLFTDARTVCASKLKDILHLSRLAHTDGQVLEDNQRASRGYSYYTCVCAVYSWRTGSRRRCCACSSSTVTCTPRASLTAQAPEFTSHITCTGSHWMRTRSSSCMLLCAVWCAMPCYCLLPLLRTLKYYCTNAHIIQFGRKHCQNSTMHSTQLSNASSSRSSVLYQIRLYCAAMCSLLLLNLTLQVCVRSSLCLATPCYYDSQKRYCSGGTTTLSGSSLAVG